MRSRPARRWTEIPPPIWAERASWRATASTRSRVVSVGGWASPSGSAWRSQLRRARRARGAGAAASSATDVGSMEAARASSRSASSARRAAWRATTAATSRSAISSSSGSSWWRIRLRRWLGSSLLGSSTMATPSSAHSWRVSTRRRARMGWRGPGRMPASPSSPAPRTRLSRMVSAWSSAVWPVAASGGSTCRRAARARASRLGPGATATRSDRKAAPNRPAASATRPASADEPARSPWSTWTAVTRQPASTARIISAIESAPPDTAQVSSVPAGGKAQRANSSLRRGTTLADGPAAGWPGSGLGEAGDRTLAGHADQLGDARHREAPGDAPEAGVDVRAADPQLGGGLLHGRGLAHHPEQLALLVGQRRHRFGVDLGRPGRGPARLRRVVEAGQAGAGLALEDVLTALELGPLDASQLLEGGPLGGPAQLGLGSVLEGAAEVGPQVRPRERLGQVEGGPLDAPPDPVHLVGAGGEEDDGDRRGGGLGVGLEGGEHVEAVHARHREVEQHGVVGVLVNQIERRLAVAGDGHLVPVHLQRDADELGDVGFVVNHQDPGHSDSQAIEGGGGGVPG